MPALEAEDNYPSNGSLLQQNGIKYSSEPELVVTKENAREGYGGCSVSCEGSEGPELEGYINIEADRGGQFCLSRNSMASCILYFISSLILNFMIHDHVMCKWTILHE